MNQRRNDTAAAAAAAAVDELEPLDAATAWTPAPASAAASASGGRRGLLFVGGGGNNGDDDPAAAALSDADLELFLGPLLRPSSSPSDSSSCSSSSSSGRKRKRRRPHGRKAPPTAITLPPHRVAVTTKKKKRRVSDINDGGQVTVGGAADGDGGGGGRRPGRRRAAAAAVRFDTTNVRVHEPREKRQQAEEGEPPSSAWYSRWELHELKREAKKLCSACQIDWELSHVLKQADSCDCRKKQEEEEGEQIRNDTESPKKEGCCRCQRCCAHMLVGNADFLEQRGLERWSSARHYRARGLLALSAKTKVFLEQSAQAQLQLRNADKLAALCKMSSQTAVSLALIMAEADALVASRSDG